MDGWMIPSKCRETMVARFRSFSAHIISSPSLLLLSLHSLCSAKDADQLLQSSSTSSLEYGRRKTPSLTSLHDPPSAVRFVVQFWGRRKVSHVMRNQTML
jgi:hypothetical protein